MLDTVVKPTEVRVGNRLDLQTVPLDALGSRTRDLIGELLNQRRIFTTEDGYSRDWRGVFELVGLPKSYLALVSSNKNPTRTLLHLWESETQQCKRGANLAELQSVLGCIDRWDILDDTAKILEQDAEQYLLKEQKRMAQKMQLTDSKDYPDSEIITKDDMYGHKQQYDAFILFADADIEFASKMVDRLEARGMNLCLKDRDILGGSSFEHEVIARLISERCRRVVVIISKAFLESPLNDFSVTFAQAFQIENKARKVIPCVYERCELPQNLRYTSLLDYQRSKNLYNFWDKLADSIRETPKRPTALQMTVREKPLPKPPTTVTARQPIPKLVPADEPSTLMVKLPPSPEPDSGLGTLKKSHSFWDLFSGFSHKKDKLTGSTSTLNLNDIAPSVTSLNKKRGSSPLGLFNREKKLPFSASSASIPTTATLAAMVGKEEKPAKPKKKWYKSMGRKVATAM